MWLKYSNEEIVFEPTQTYEQSSELNKYEKPCGFWITDDSDRCWRSWCVAESYGLNNLTHKHEIVLDESKMLLLRSASEIRAFTRQYGADRTWRASTRVYVDRCIDWKRVAAEYSGLIITPYIWECRLEDGQSWYYGWDCASGCIWDASAIQSVRLLSVEPCVAADAEAA